MAVLHRIQTLRKERGMTQLQLAESSGVSLPIVVRLDSNGAARIALDTALRLAGALGVSPEDLLV